MQIRKASRLDQFARFAVMGVSGAGKTYSAIRIGSGLLEEGERLLVISTEYGSADKYEGCDPDGRPWDYDVLEIGDNGFHPTEYMKALQLAMRSGYRVVVVDSISHEWEGERGVLDSVGGNFNKWKDLTPLHNRFLRAIATYPGHIICTMRQQMKYEDQQDHRGKKVKVAIGLEPIQRKGIIYEFDLVLALVDQVATVEKTRCDTIKPGTKWPEPGLEVAAAFREWLQSGRDNAAEWSSQLDAAIPEGLTRGQVDAYLSAQGREPLHSLTPAKRASALAWLTKLEPEKVMQVVGGQE